MKEANLEKAVIETLVGEGWNWIPPALQPVREDYRNPLLREKLGNIARLPVNRGLKAQAIAEAIKRIDNVEGTALISRNRTFTDYLQNGVEVSWYDENVEVYREEDCVEVRCEQGEVETARVRLIDVEHPEANDFTVVNQWTVQGQNAVKRPDVVLFVNGLPLVVLELKSPSREATDEKDAYLQIRNYLKDIPELFVYNQICATSDMLTNRAGTITSGEDRFMEWKSVDGEYEDREAAAFETFFKGLLSPKRLVDVVKNFILFSNEGRGDPVKILAGYHQYFAVRKAIAKTKKACGRDGKGGVFWHTQGSGKSLSMVFYAKLLQSALESPTIVVLTDRNNLDEQLFEQFAKCEEFLRQKPVMAKSRANLKKLLSGRVANGMFFSTIQKFEEGDEPLNTRSNIIVIADEAHRSHYGLAERKEMRTNGLGQRIIKEVIGTARIIRDSLPKATYIAFTGTPIDEKDRSTREVFGDYIDIYDMIQSVKDGATKPVYYENRVIKLKLNDEVMKAIDGEYDRLKAEDKATDQVLEQSKRDLSNMEVLLGHPETIEALVHDVITHYEDTRAKILTGKAMVVAYSREIAMKIYERMLKERPGWKDKIALVMTESNQDPEEWHELVGNNQHRQELSVQFKDNSSALKIAIVVDMWLTGFNVPSLATMYVYKPMVGHNLMQAIARVNRVYGKKEGGLVVDYVGIGAELKEAMAKYTRGGKGRKAGTGGDIDETAKNVFLENLEICRDQFHGFNYAKGLNGSDLEQCQCVKDALNFLLPPEMKSRREAFLLAALNAHRALQLCASVIDKPLREEAAFFEAVRVLLNRCLAKGGAGKISVRELNGKISALLKNTIGQEGVVDIFSDREEKINIFSEAFLEELKRMKERNLAVEMLKGLVMDKLRQYRGTDIVKSEKFSALLTATYNKYINGLLTNVQVFRELLDLAKNLMKLQAEENALGLSPEESAFYSALTATRAVKDFYEKRNPELIALTKELTDTLRKNRTIDWQLRDAARAKMRLMVKKLLKKYKYPPNEAQEAMEIVLRQCEFWTDNAPEEEIPYDEYKHDSVGEMISMIKEHTGNGGLKSGDVRFDPEAARAFTVKPAWGWLIMKGIKDIENRSITVLPPSGVCVVTFSKSYTEAEHLDILDAIDDAKVRSRVPEYEELKKLCGKAVGLVNYDVLETSDSPWYYEGNIPWKVSRPRWFKKPFDVSGFVGMWKMKPADARKVLKAF